MERSVRWSMVNWLNPVKYFGIVHQPVDKTKLLWHAMLALGERLAQGLRWVGWAVKVATVDWSC